MDFHKTVRVENAYVWSGFVPQTILSHTRDPFLGSKDADPINANKQVNNQQCFNEK